VAGQEGISAPRHRTPVRANYARKVYAKEQRRELHDKFLSLTEAQLDQGQMTPREMKELAQAITIVAEKRRLEDDEAGSVTATRSGTPHPGTINLEEEFAKLDAQFRGEE
jgi:hypothetical protein